MMIYDGIYGLFNNNCYKLKTSVALANDHIVFLCLTQRPNLLGFGL